MDRPLQARLVNAGGELIAEGPCWLDEAAGQATMEPERTPGVLQKERGRLALLLETGRSLLVSDRPMVLRLRRYNGGGREVRRRLYRLRLMGAATDGASQVLPEGRTAGATGTRAQEAEAAGAAAEGSPAAPTASGRPRLLGETPAAR